MKLFFYLVFFVFSSRLCLAQPERLIAASNEFKLGKNITVDVHELDFYGKAVSILVNLQKDSGWRPVIGSPLDDIASKQCAANVVETAIDLYIRNGEIEKANEWVIVERDFSQNDESVACHLSLIEALKQRTNLLSEKTCNQFSFLDMFD